MFKVQNVVRNVEGLCVEIEKKVEKNVEIMDGVVFLGETREPRKLADAADLSIDEWK